MTTVKTIDHASVDAQLKALTRRVAALEAGMSRTPEDGGRIASVHLDNAAAPDDRFWALNGLTLRAPEGGSVLYTGQVTLPGGSRVAWQKEAACVDLLRLNWGDVSETIAALAHPVRLAVLRACLGQQRSTQDLLALAGMGTSGQLFHHLKTLQQAGWLRSAQRGLYDLPADRVVPLLAILTAATA